MSAPPTTADRGEPLLRVRHLTTIFRTEGGLITAVDDVSLDVWPGETLGLVGESGCGKSVTAKSILRLLPEGTAHIADASRVRFAGEDLAHADEKAMRRVRGDRIAMVFQEPMTSLNPVFTIGWQLDEALRIHTRLGRHERRARTLERLRLVEIPDPERLLDAYPHQLSGGMRQRVMIAMALACDPELLIADEPTTALDVTTQAQILRLLKEVQAKLGTAIVLITHDLGVVAQACDRVCVLYAGRVIEESPVRDLLRAPRHPYTRALFDSIPKPGARGERLPTLDGTVPALTDLPPGCRFHDRCPIAEERCRAEEPALLPHALPARPVRCHRPLSTEGRSDA